MAGDDAADGEAHGVTPSGMVWGGSFDGRGTIAIGLNAHRLLYPQKQTSVNLIGMSVKCQ
jgi:hypothetical protein